MARANRRMTVFLLGAGCIRPAIYGIAGAGRSLLITMFGRSTKVGDVQLATQRGGAKTSEPGPRPYNSDPALTSEHGAGLRQRVQAIGAPR